MKERVLIGAGGHAREVMFQMGIKLPMYVDKNYSNPDLGIFSITDLDPDKHIIMIAIGDPVIRNKIANDLNAQFSFFTFVHETAIVDSQSHIGHGSFIGAYSIITTNVRIGDHSILNRHCQIGHDSRTGNYLSMMPGSVISGNVRIGNGFYLGTNSSVKEGLVVTDEVKLGLNSGVIKNISESGVYAGLPAKKII